MGLAPGGRLGPYEIVALLGTGGMGEVYRARDTRLDRAVALKVLHTALAAEPTQRARFEREARAISALQHPHICTLHDVGEEDGQAYLVMEHLEGEPLAGLLRRGALPLERALDVAAQIADALAAAHRAGVIHRDLKPGNVMLTKTGAKLLDFGLARLAGHGERPVLEDATSAATESAPLTGRGTILGTIPYMSPEQLEGRPADERSDIWALGAILYEMIAGRRAFEGTNQASLVAAILEREPAALATLQPATPPSLDRLVRRCLAKSPDDRWDSAHDVADELRWIAQGGLWPTVGAAANRRKWWRWAVGGVGLAAVSAVGGALADRLFRPPQAPPTVVRTLLDIHPGEDVDSGTAEYWLPTPGGSRTSFAWTPDGRALVVIGRKAGTRLLYVRKLDQEEAMPLPGTEGARVLAVSLDGQWVAFWASGSIRKISLAGGPASTLVEHVAETPSGMSWGPSERLFYDSGPRPPVVAEEGGVIWSVEPERPPVAATRRLGDETTHGLPHCLPGGRVLLYTVRHGMYTWGDEEVVAQDLGTGARRVLLREAADARYAPPGHLLFVRRGTLFAVAFDPSRAETRGTPFPVLDLVAQALAADFAGDITGAGQYAVSPTGALALLRSAVPSYPGGRLLTVDRQGRVQTLEAGLDSLRTGVAISPDGRQLALVTKTLDEQCLWAVDLHRGSRTKLTGTGEASRPRWTPDGQRIVFSWLNRGASQLGWVRADGMAPPEVFASIPGAPSAWSPDGRRLAIVRGGDIWVATVDGKSVTVAPLRQTPEAEQWAELSPDGRWLAYGSDASGRNEVYVQSFPGPGPRVQVSLHGGEVPAWNPMGGELFYGSPADPEGHQSLMAVDVRLAATISIGASRRLFSSPVALSTTLTRSFAVSPDGQLFYSVEPNSFPPPPRATQIHLVQNWLQNLKARVPPATGR